MCIPKLFVRAFHIRAAYIDKLLLSVFDVLYLYCIHLMKDNFQVLLIFHRRQHISGLCSFIRMLLSASTIITEVFLISLMS